MDETSLEVKCRKCGDRKTIDVMKIAISRPFYSQNNLIVHEIIKTDEWEKIDCPHCSILKEY